MEGKAFRQREQCTQRNRGQRVAADRRMWPNFLNDNSTSYGPIQSNPELSFESCPSAGHGGGWRDAQRTFPVLLELCLSRQAAGM